MTVIRDPLLPRVEVEPMDGSRLRRRLLALFAASALCLTLANLAVASYLVCLASEVRALQAGLQDIDAVEKRIKADLDVVNQGVQARLEDLDQSVRSGVAELKQARTDIQRTSTQPNRDQTAAIEIDAPELASLATEAEAPDIEAEPTKKAAEPRKVRKPKPAAEPVSEVASSYQRIETPDGKVYYRRVK